MEKSIRGREDMKVLADKSLGEGELKIKLIAATTVDGKEADVFELEGSVLVSALFNKEEDGFHVSMMGDMGPQIGAVNAIVAGIVGRIMSFNDPGHRIHLMTGLTMAIADGLGGFDPFAGLTEDDDSAE